MQEFLDWCCIIFCSLFSDIDIYKPSEELPDVDAIIVTPIHAYEAIEESLSKKMDCLIMSIEDIIYEM